ncbi:MAG: FIST N-terminal domain-containing protein [Terrimicrobiaceae bacterium]
MEAPRAVSVEIPGPFQSGSVRDAAFRIRDGLGHPARVAVVFVSSDYLPHLSEFVETLRVDGHISNVVGCTSGGRIVDRHEVEKGPGCSILALRCDAGEPVSWEGRQSACHFSGPRPHACILLANPFHFEADGWLRQWNAEYPGAAAVGGLASGGEENDVAVFLNDRLADAVCLPLAGRDTILPLVSQGCRPIGEPLTVTRAEHNIVYALGGQPAYDALETAFESLSDSEKSVAKGNLFAGLAGTEYLDDFKPGDFLIRTIIGADPGTGAVVIGGIPRTGQTLQYQLRDREIAKADLKRVLATGALHGVHPFATLLFSCLGRGERFFGNPNHDASCFYAAARGSPLAGFFCNGEIAPVAGRNAMHGYTAAAALWVEKSD